MYPRVVHREEAMREGMQVEDRNIPVAAKVKLLDALSAAGLRDINIGSFVSPKWTPQMEHIEELVQSFDPHAGVRYTYLALNERGRERARQYIPPLSERDEPPTTTVDMCDVFAQRNFNRTQQQQIAAWDPKIESAVAGGATEAGITAGSPWGSNWTGDVSDEQLMLMLDRQHQRWTDAGVTVTRVNLLDAMSWNMPHRVDRTLYLIKERWPSIREFNLHLHNARAMALPSVYAALCALDGTDTLHIQSAIGGMGGCPYCGNGRAAMMIATEDLMHMLEDMGIETGADVRKLIEASWLAEEVVGHQLWGFVSKAGPRPGPDDLYAMDMPFIETFEEAKHFILGSSTYEGTAISPWTQPLSSYQRED